MARMTTVHHQQKMAFSNLKQLIRALMKFSDGGFPETPQWQCPPEVVSARDLFEQPGVHNTEWKLKAPVPGTR